MRRGWKVALGMVLALAALLAVNTIVTDQQTKPAGVTVDGGRILHLTGGDIQVVEGGPKDKRHAGAPIVLLHCYGCSLQWWDRVTPLLERRHRVIRIDLFGRTARLVTDIVITFRSRTEITLNAAGPSSAARSISAAEVRLARTLVTRVRA